MVVPMVDLRFFERGRPLVNRGAKAMLDFNKSGSSALGVAARNGHISSARLLVEAGARLDLGESFSGRTSAAVAQDKAATLKRNGDGEKAGRCADVAAYLREQAGMD